MLKFVRFYSGPLLKLPPILCPALSAGDPLPWIGSHLSENFRSSLRLTLNDLLLCACDLQLIFSTMTVLTVAGISSVGFARYGVMQNSRTSWSEMLTGRNLFQVWLPFIWQPSNFKLSFQSKNACHAIDIALSEV